MGDLFGDALSVYFRHFITLVGVAAVAYLVPLILSTALLTWLSQWPSTTPVQAGKLTDGHNWLRFAAIIGGVGVVSGMVAIISQLLAMAVITLAVFRALAGQGIYMRELFSIALSRLKSILGAVLLGAAVAGVLALTIVGIPVAVYFLVTWALVVPVVVLERQRARQALSRSASLVKGHWWRVFVSAVLVSLVAGGFPMVFSLVAGALAANNFWLSGLLPGLLNVLFAPVYPVAFLLVYFDLRVRKEGLTLAKLNSEVV